jgi:uncharacterized repeat protein (TIGR02543 family)
MNPARNIPNRQKRSLLAQIAFCICCGSLAVAAPEISGVTAQQRPGTKLIDITYSVTSQASTVDVTLEVSADGGATFSVPVNNVTGSVGENVSVGEARVITWNAGIDWDNQSSNQVRFRLISTPVRLAKIPGGVFTMGTTSGDSDSDAPSINVNVSGFYMGRYEVTRAEWSSVRSWALANGYPNLASGSGGSDHPVHAVSWWDAVKWCNARSEMEGLEPVYKVSGVVLRTGTTLPTPEWNANGYRLPTEAEWEKAARGGRVGLRYPWGDTIDHSAANFNNNSASYPYVSGTVGYHPSFIATSFPYTSPVGTFAPNAFGIYDTVGNILEWCWDWYGASAYIDGATDPRGAVTGGGRVCRGGNWNRNAFECRISYRTNINPSNANSNYGFRVVRSPEFNGGDVGISGNTVVTTTSWILATSTSANGTIQGAGTYVAGADADLIAVADPGYVFTGWTGDATGADSPFALNMDSDKMVGATFGPDLSDVDNDGLTAYDEVVLHGTDPTIADTDGDGFSDSFELSSGFSAISTASTPESRSGIVLGSGDAEGSVEFRFNGAAGVSYRIEATTTLDDWGTLDALVIGTGGSMSKSYTMAGNPVRFFRLIRN